MVRDRSKGFLFGFHNPHIFADSTGDDFHLLPNSVASLSNAGLKTQNTKLLKYFYHRIIDFLLTSFKTYPQLESTEALKEMFAYMVYF